MLVGVQLGILVEALGIDVDIELKVLENPNLVPEVEAAGLKLLQELLNTKGKRLCRPSTNPRDVDFDKHILDNRHFMASNTGAAVL